MAVRTVNRTFSISPQHDKDLRRLSKKLKTPMSELIREAITLLGDKYQPAA